MVAYNLQCSVIAEFAS